MENIKRFIKKNKKWLILSILILIFIILAQKVLENPLLKIDNEIYKLIIKPIRNDTNTKLFKILTNMASSITLTALCIIFIITFKRKRYSVLIVINLINVMALNTVLKIIFSRPRPEELMLIKETGYSFPSGHSMASMGFYGFLIYLIWKTNYSKKIKVVISILLGTIIFLVGLSRIYLGVHYTTDVIGGFVISIAYLIIFTEVIKEKATS